MSWKNLFQSVSELDPQEMPDVVSPKSANRQSNLPVTKFAKVLLLGAGDSGKTTLAKHVKIINNQPMSENDLKRERDPIRNSIVRNFRLIAEMSANYDFVLDSDSRELATELYEYIEKYPDWTDEFTKRMINFWNDDNVQLTVTKGSEFHLDNSVLYFASKLAAIGKESYIPSQEDVLHSRTKTIGLIEHKVIAQGCEITIIDVGGQRSERKKWKQAFEHTNVLVYVVAISDFDQTCYEDSTTNRMQESLLLFHETTRSPWFKNSTIIIVFNKIDIFREKVRKGDIRDAFPEYGGGKDYANAIEFITKKFTSQLEDKTADVIYTTATDTESIMSGWEKMKQLIVNNVK